MLNKKKKQLSTTRSSPCREYAVMARGIKLVPRDTPVKQLVLCLPVIFLENPKQKLFWVIGVDFGFLWFTQSPSQRKWVDLRTTGLVHRNFRHKTVPFASL